MEILSSLQIKQWDAYTCEHQHITSPELMERAATGCLQWLEAHGYGTRTCIIFCGNGNNGGDGLALARLLHQKQSAVVVYLLDDSKGSGDYMANLDRLKETGVLVKSLAEPLPVISKADVVIDALFGSGLNRPLEGLARQVVDHINGSGSEVIAIDIPSGMYADKSSFKDTVVKAAHSLSFQLYKQAFLVAEKRSHYRSCTPDRYTARYVIPGNSACYAGNH